MQIRRFATRSAALAGFFTLSSSLAIASLNPNQVLVVYNSEEDDSANIYQFYKTVYPSVLGFDLKDPKMGAGNITYNDYEAKIASKLRNFLSSNNLQSQIACITMTKGLPHRIIDINQGNIGDNPSQPLINLVNGGNATYASVDSEISLLWQNLRNGENNGRMDSRADNFVLNPYHGRNVSFTSFNRTNVAQNKTFVNNGGFFWTMQKPGGAPADAGDIYMVSRLDARTRQQVYDMVDRAVNILFDRNTDRLILDKPSGGTLDNGNLGAGDPGYSGPDYTDTFAAMSGTWANFQFDQTNNFIIGNSGSPPNYPAPPAGPPANHVRYTGPVAAYSSYGTNGGGLTGYVKTFNGQLVNGAIFNTIESYNGRDFGGIGGFIGQGQLAEWIEAGGTFGIGNVWEPFSFSVADNEHLWKNFFDNGLTWAEAAWSSIPWISWQQMVIGDPLARAVFVPADLVPEPGTTALLALAATSLLRRARWN